MVDDRERASPTTPESSGEGPSAPAPEDAQVTPDVSPDALAEMEDRLRRALADLDNLRKRTARELAEARASERARVAVEWLPVVDNLDRALHHADADAASLVAGIRAVRDLALSTLARLGFPRLEDVGEPFDPVRHEAVGTLDSDAPAGTVVAVVRPGYGTPEAVLRPAGVMVAKGAE